RQTLVLARIGDQARMARQGSAQRLEKRLRLPRRHAVDARLDPVALTFGEAACAPLRDLLDVEATLSGAAAESRQQCAEKGMRVGADQLSRGIVRTQHLGAGVEVDELVRRDAQLEAAAAV